MNAREILLSPIAAIQWLWTAWMTALTETRIRRSLKAGEPLLAFVAGGTPYRGGELPDSTEFLFPELTIQAQGFNRYVSSAKALLRLCLDVPGERRVLLETTVALTARPKEIGGMAIRWRGTSLARLQGQAVLRVFVAEIELVSFPLALVSTAQLLERLRVSGLCLNAQLAGGKRVSLPRRIVVSRLEAIAPSFTVESPSIAPGSEFGGRVLLLQGRRVLAGVPFRLRLDRGKTEIKTGRAQAPSGIAPGDSVELRVEIGGAVKASHQILTLGSDPITSFDGSLTAEAWAEASRNGGGQVDFQANPNPVEEKP